MSVWRGRVEVAGGVVQDVDGERFGAIVDGELGGHTDERGEVFHEAVGDAVDLFLVLQEAAGPVMAQVQPSVEGGQGADPFVWPGDLSGPAPVSAACRLPSSPHAFTYAPAFHWRYPACRALYRTRL